MKRFIEISMLMICLSVPLSNAQQCVEKDTGLTYLRTNLGVLASDLFEGREISTRGESLAAMYIASELKKYGCKPFGDSGTYFENFKVFATSIDSNSTVKIIDQEDKVRKLSLGKDFYLSTRDIPSEKFSGIESSIVFAGYGITAKDYNYDDYKTLDINGKVVLLLSGSPANDGKNIFSEETSEKFSETSYKLINAMQHNAVGILILPDKRISRYWRWLKARSLSTSFELLKEPPTEKMKLANAIPLIILSNQSAVKLLSGEKYSYDDLVALDNSVEIPVGFELNKKVKMDYKINTGKRTAKNIIGLIEGNDENLKDQYVVISAHYDHEGIRNGEVYYGADDDGSGTVAILEAARRISCLQENKRSVLVIFHTGEEKGLLGSEYLTTHAKFMKNIDADINLDMVGRGSVDTIYSIGSGKLSSELHDLVERVNSETVNLVLNYKFDAPNDPNKYYYRSDHYNYAKHSIPVVFFYDHMMEDYHKPSDDVEKINFEKIEKISTLVTELAIRIADKDHKLIIDKTDGKSGEEYK